MTWSLTRAMMSSTTSPWKGETGAAAAAFLLTEETACAGLGRGASANAARTKVAAASKRERHGMGRRVIKNQSRRLGGCCRSGEPRAQTLLYAGPVPVGRRLASGPGHGSRERPLRSRCSFATADSMAGDLASRIYACSERNGLRQLTVTPRPAAPNLMYSIVCSAASPCFVVRVQRI